MNALQALETTACCLSRIEQMLTEEYDYEVLATPLRESGAQFLLRKGCL